MQKAVEADVKTGCMDVSDAEVSSLMAQEWLLTNRRGSYSSGTLVGCHTRRYHGLLVASLRPPVERHVTLSNLLEKFTIDSEPFELATFEFSDRLHPQGYRHLKWFRRDGGVSFGYDLGPVQVTKSIHLSYDEDVVVITYDLSGQKGPVDVSLLPLVALRDFHSLQSSSASLTLEQEDSVVTVRGLDPQGPAVHLACRQASFERGSDWWYSVHYRRESLRGQHDYEDVWVPGGFEGKIECPGRITFVAQATGGLERPGPLHVDVNEFAENLHDRNVKLVQLAQAKDKYDKALVRAADQFVVQRRTETGRDSVSILAGYHWFADWGRDTFISLPGLLLTTGRHDEARQVLATFGDAVSEGMIPNKFDDYGGDPHYNSVDASLWYANAAYQYLLATQDRDGFMNEFRPVISEIIAGYQKGTRFNIHADDDGLIIAGDKNTQLTWMDAKCNDVSFTPRHGKAVEINALWINALHIMAETAGDKGQAQAYAARAAQAGQSFIKLFWNEKYEFLNDCVAPDGAVDATLRPNQVFAISLPFSCLDLEKQHAIVHAVRENLLTPYGLRSLSPRDGRYQGRYGGDQFQRDSAYHQGTTWAFLLGRLVEAFLKAHDYSGAARQMGREMIQPLLEHINENACLGSISEIFDGDWPHRPKGCVAQAWSVAELLRVKKLLG